MGPSSTPAQLEEDALPRTPVFRFNNLQTLLKPYFDFKKKLSEDHGLTFGLDYSALYQRLSKTLGEKQAATGIFRVYGGPKIGDLAVATRPATPGAWTHYAVTRSAEGVVKIYINGELDATGARRHRATYSGLNIGQTTPADAGTALLLSLGSYLAGQESAEIDLENVMDFGVTHRI